MTIDSFDGALAYLKKVDSVNNGQSVYEHLTSVLMRILEEQPQNAIDLLESSLLTKKTAKAHKLQSIPGPSSFSAGAAQAAQTVATCNIFKQPEVPIDPDTGEQMEADPLNDYEMEDIAQQGQLLEAAGIGLSRTESYQVSLAGKKLGEDPNLQVATVRFFGKIFGINSDYYIFETTLKEYPEEEEQEGAAIPMERQSGANAFTYFVCNYLGGPVTKLPDVKPEHIKTARLLKRYLTGKLSSKVATYPPFTGTEAEFLRAQIARIACATVLAPAGMFTAGEEGEIEKAEEFEALPPREMGLAENWAHKQPHLKMQGRCVVHAREPPEGEEEEFELTEEEQEEGPEALSACANDAEVDGKPAWSPVFSSRNEGVKYQVAGIKSNLWPGAYAVCQGTNFVNVYVGWGYKNMPYVPQPPPPVAKECDQKLVESSELPPKPQPEGEAEEE